MTKWLEVKFFSDGPIDDLKLHKMEKYNSKYQGIARFANEKEIPSNFFKHVRNSYLMS